MSMDNTQAARAPAWQNEPSQLELLVDIVSGKRGSEYNGATRTLTLQVPTHNALLIEAMLENTTGISRNELICQLLDLALQEVREKLPQDINENILQFVSVEMDSSDDKLLKFK